VKKILQIGQSTLESPVGQTSSPKYRQNNLILVGGGKSVSGRYRFLKILIFRFLVFFVKYTQTGDLGSTALFSFAVL
jgi:hypothetical protein